MQFLNIIRRQSNSAVTLLEILIAMVVMGVLALGMVALFTTSTQFSRRAENLVFALGIQQEIYEFLSREVCYRDGDETKPRHYFDTGVHAKADTDICDDRTGPRGTIFTVSYRVVDENTDPREVRFSINWNE